MKRVVIFLLVAVMVFGMVGCGEPAVVAPEEVPQSTEVVREKDVNKFIENYKRSDVATLTEDFGEFVADLYATLDGMAGADLSGWTVPDFYPEDWPYGEYEIETVMFNLPATVSFSDYSDESGTTGGCITVSFSTDDHGKDIDIANALCEYALKEYSDADSITFTDTSTPDFDTIEITEHEWREDYYAKGNCDLAWETITETHGESLRISNFSTKYTSKVSVSVICVDANE